MAATLAAAIQSTKFAADSLRALAGLKVDTATILRINEAAGQVADARADLLDAQEVMNSQADRIRELAAQVAAFGAWQERATQYALRKVTGGAVVYVFKDAADPHFACPKCFEDRKVSVLQDTGSDTAGTLRCVTCTFDFRVNTPVPWTNSSYTAAREWE